MPDELTPRADAEPLPCGLTSAEAARRFGLEGANELAPPHRTSALEVFVRVATEPMFLLLVAGGLIYLVIGSPTDALLLLAGIVLILGISVAQQRKTERVLESLRDLSSPRALVLRDGVKHRIAGREVVRGDTLLLTEGDRIAADAVLLAGQDVLVNKSMLTGESVPVRKHPVSGPVPEAMRAQPGGDDQPFVYAGTLMVRGTAIGRVLAIGAASAIGRIGVSLQHAPPPPSPLQRQMRALIRRMAILAVALSLVLAIIYAALRGDVLQGLLAGITLAMAILPEELPVVLTVFLALGARRISKSRVLTRHMDAIETLGATTVLASDKTGTLTENRMAIRKVYADGETLRIDGTAALPEAFHALIEFGILASNRDPFDPMEQALHALGRQALYQTEHLHGEDGRWEVVHAYSLSPDLLAMSRVWRTGADPPGRIDYVVAAKGAPEAVADLCHLDSAQLLAVQRAAAEMAAEGLRVLGVARGTLRHAELLQGGDLAWPTHQHDIDFRFVGLVALEDPIRAGVADAVRTAQQAGIRVVMITGDHAHTAQAIARQLGLPAARVVTGEEIDAMTDAALSACVRDTSIYARSVPQQKLRLVRALQANGAIVAMTGDGVNDAPALKSAHIGVAMGKRGTDVAREAAALVLLDDDFSSIVTTLRHGRRVFDNLRKAVIYIVAVHVPIVGVSFVPVLLGQPLLLLPAHILFLELVIDPVCSIAFEAEPEEPDLMQRPPRDPATPMFGTGLLAFGLGQGLVALGAALAVYAWLLAHAAPPAVVRTAVFTTMALASLALVVNCRSLRRSARAPRGRGNRAFYGVAVAALGGLALVFGVPWLRELFRFTTPDFATLGVAVAAALATFGVNELLKRVQARLVRQTS